MGWLDRLRIARAAKRYAQRLPGGLVEGWRGSDIYTPAQIRVAVKALKLDQRFIALGYAAFLPREDFEALRPEMQVALDYDEARAAFARWRPGGASAFDPPPASSYVISGR